MDCNWSVRSGGIHVCLSIMTLRTHGWQEEYKQQ